MPISFVCPHCGTRSNVPEQYAGQTGPCGTCGKPITIPRGASAMPASSSGSSSGITWIVIGVVVLFGLLACGGVLLAILLPAVNAARTAARTNISQNNLSGMGKSLALYRATNGAKAPFPAAYVADANGKPLYSWRVMLLPYMDRGDLYNKWDKTKAWDSPENKAISDTVLEMFHNPNEQSVGTTFTDYVAVVGKETVFVPPPLRPIGNIPDGETYTVVVVEIAHSKIHWAEPVDLDFSTMSMKINDPNGNCISSSAPRGANVLFADGHVKPLDRNVSPTTVRAILTRDGNEEIPVDFDGF